MFDPRLSQVRKIVESIVSKSMFNWTKVLVTETNTLVITVSNTLLYQIQLKDITESYPPVSFIYSDIYELPEDECINDKNIASDLSYTVNLYNNISVTCPIVAQNNELRNDDKFEELLSLSTDNDLKYYQMPGIKPESIYMVPMFSGFISLSKLDTIGITIYDIQDGFLLLRMNIFKKKINREIIVDCRIINI